MSTAIDTETVNQRQGEWPFREGLCTIHPNLTPDQTTPWVSQRSQQYRGKEVSHKINLKQAARKWNGSQLFWRTVLPLRNWQQYCGLGSQRHRKQNQRGFWFSSCLSRRERAQEAAEGSKDGVLNARLQRLDQKRVHTAYQGQKHNSGPEMGQWGWGRPSLTEVVGWIASQ